MKLVVYLKLTVLRMFLNLVRSNKALNYTFFVKLKGIKYMSPSFSN